MGGLRLAAGFRLFAADFILREVFNRQLCMLVLVRLFHLGHVFIVKLAEQQSVLLTVCDFVLNRYLSILQVLDCVVHVHAVFGCVDVDPGLLVGFLLLF